MTQENPAGLGSDSWSDRRQVGRWAKDGTERRPTEATSHFPFRRISVAVTIRLLDGYVTIEDSRGESLGSWSVIDVTAAGLGGPRYLLTLGDQKVVFYADGPMELVRDMEAEADYFKKRSEKSTRRRPVRVFEGHLLGLQTAATPRNSEPNEPPPPLSSEDIGLNHGVASDPLKYADVGDDSLRVESLKAKLAAAQSEVTRSIGEGMLSWFGYYLRLSEGTDLERLSRTGQGLHAAASQLRGIAGDLEYLSESESSPDNGLLRTYHTAVGNWATALEMLGQGALRDHRRTAEDGFRSLSAGTVTAEKVVDRRARSRLSTATATAEKVVDRWARTGLPDTLSESLSALRRLRPAAKVSRAALRRAKEPWKRAVIAAGSPLRWSD